MSRVRAFRGAILHFRDDPGSASPAASHEYLEDGILLVDGGRIASCTAAAGARLPREVEVVDHRGRLILPGFVDLHVHYAQTDVIASPGRNVLDWLERYTFPEEERFADAAHAREVADFFLDELVRNGTTTALVFATCHRASAQAFFEAAEGRRLRMAAGQVMMDRHCPESLRTQQLERHTRELVERWDGRGRLHYALTPRFAITSSAEQLALAGRLARDYPGTFVHSHLAEHPDEVARVRELFPECRSYLDVYARHGLLRERAVYAHCIHLEPGDRRIMAEAGAAAAFCPTSNLFLGSGLFDLEASDAAGLAFALGTDVAGGTSFSMLRTMEEAYKVAQLQGQHLTALRAFYLATRGAARALRLDERIGSFETGREADFIVLDPEATPLLARRQRAARTLEERLFAWMVLGDERAVAATYVLGEALKPLRPPPTPG